MGMIYYEYRLPEMQEEAARGEALCLTDALAFAVEYLANNTDKDRVDVQIGEQGGCLYYSWRDNAALMGANRNDPLPILRGIDRGTQLNWLSASRRIGEKIRCSKTLNRLLEHS